MKIFKVGFKSDYTYSINMIWANTGKEEREAVEETAARRAARYGYKVAFVKEITESEAQSNAKKGMPYYSIDEQAERDHDPSFAEEVSEDKAEQDHTMTENILYLEKRGCDFFPNDPDCLESDVGNYRVQTPGYDIPTEDGRRYMMEFTCYNRYKYRFISKRNGRKLKHPVRELVMTSACSLSPYWMDDNGTCWGDCKLTQSFYQTPRKYTIQNILDYVNSISATHFNRIEFIAC